jgi:hypothetical protein
VGEWLQAKGDLAKYASIFVQEGVTGRALVAMTEDTLKHNLEVRSLGHRKEIMRQVRAAAVPWHLRLWHPSASMP